MRSAGDPAVLRPLSLGEVFDRAVTLYVRNALVFTLIVLVVVVPVAILNYFAGQHESATFTQILDQIQHPGKTPASQAAGADEAFGFGVIGLSVVVGAFVIVAIASAVGELYRTGGAQFGACYAYTLRRTGSIIVALLCEIAVFVFVVFAGAFAMGIIFVAAFLLVRASAPLGVVAFVAAAIVGILWLAGMMLCYLAFAFAFNALGNEGIGAGRAIARGFSRVFNRSELLRATLICLALIAIYVGLMIVSLSVTAVFESLHLHILTVLVTAAISLVTTAFLGVLLAVYYFDVRVRREGLDMQAQIDAFGPTASPS